MDEKVPSMLHPAPAIFVIFVGLPGSGKTTMCERLSQLLLYERSKIFTTEAYGKYSRQNRAVRVKCILRSGCPSLLLCYQALRGVLRAKPYKLSSLRRVSGVVHMRAWSEIISRRGNCVVLLDEWIEARLAQFIRYCRHPITLEHTRCILKCFYKNINAKFVFLDVTPELSLDRIRTELALRPTWQDSNQSVVQERLFAYQSYYKTIKDIVAADSNATYCVLSGEDALEENVRAVRTIVDLNPGWEGERSVFGRRG